MLPSKHNKCTKRWYMILMWDEHRNIYMWRPNEKWVDVDWSCPSVWTAGEVSREWSRVNRKLQDYGDHEFRLINLHECGEPELIIQMKINRHGD